MKKSRVLVKNLTVIETLSCVNVIASDKTGTLTQNKMFVTSASAGIERIDLELASSPNFERTIAFNQLVSSCGLCNNASFEDEDTEVNVPIKQRKAKGDATDIALFKFSAEFDDHKKMAENYPAQAEIPFNSKNKWMVKVVRPRNSELHKTIYGVDDDMDSDIILLKGAPDYLVKKSTHIIQADGSMVTIKPEITNKIVQIQNTWCVMGQRVLIICKKRCKLDQVLDKDSKCVTELEKYIHQANDFCIIGLVGIIDPPREGIADVLSKCKSAGIRVFMITGDYALTAAAIAVQIGSSNTINTINTYTVVEMEQKFR
jgi:sodium/potassium-transporting ATPase subunit alpha